MSGRNTKRAAKPTIVQVAAAAGVSPTTVSHALNGKGRVDQATRARVERVAATLGYSANRYARGLRSGHFAAQALLLPVALGRGGDGALTLDYYMRLASGVAAELFARRQLVVLVPPVPDARDLASIPVDGAIVVEPFEGDQRLAVFYEAGLPIVTTDRDPANPDDPWCVTSDMGNGTTQLLEHLRGAGALQPALLLPDTTRAWPREVESAYGRWCAAHGSPPLVSRLPLEAGRHGAYAATSTIVAMRPAPDALVIAAERFVPGAMESLADRGVRVPDDLLVAACVDGNHARGASTPLTAFDLRPELQARAAVELLLARIGGMAPEGPTVVPGVLRVRASTTPASPFATPPRAPRPAARGSRAR
ncbi:MAG TPA: LacI family DNA-binding transcriptional regulator [Acidimicrobiales bacterium]|nr:LacI family DNA-binding transcriptional regulator [Acidimicrobiales bacterium]